MKTINRNGVQAFELDSSALRAEHAEKGLTFQWFQTERVWNCEEPDVARRERTAAKTETARPATEAVRALRGLLGLRVKTSARLAAELVDGHRAVAEPKQA